MRDSKEVKLLILQQLQRLEYKAIMNVNRLSAARHMADRDYTSFRPSEAFACSLILRRSSPRLFLQRPKDFCICLFGVIKISAFVISYNSCLFTMCKASAATKAGHNERLYTSQATFSGRRMSDGELHASVRNAEICPRYHR